MLGSRRLCAFHASNSIDCIYAPRQFQNRMSQSDHSGQCELHVLLDRLNDNTYSPVQQTKKVSCMCPNTLKPKGLTAVGSSASCIDQQAPMAGKFNTSCAVHKRNLFDVLTLVISTMLPSMPKSHVHCHRAPSATRLQVWAAARLHTNAFQAEVWCACQTSSRAWQPSLLWPTAHAQEPLQDVETSQEDVHHSKNAHARRLHLKWRRQRQLQRRPSQVQPCQAPESQDHSHHGTRNGAPQHPAQPQAHEQQQQPHPTQYFKQQLKVTADHSAPTLPSHARHKQSNSEPCQRSNTIQQLPAASSLHIPSPDLSMSTEEGLQLLLDVTHSCTYDEHLANSIVAWARNADILKTCSPSQLCQLLWGFSLISKGPPLGLVDSIMPSMLTAIPSMQVSHLSTHP